MASDPRGALQTLFAALERHLETAADRRDPDDPRVIAASIDLADAFDAYDEALFDATDVATPLTVFEGDDDDEFDDDDEDDDDEDDEDDDEDDAPDDDLVDMVDLVDLVDDDIVGDEPGTRNALYLGLDDDDIDIEPDERRV